MKRLVILLMVTILIAGTVSAQAIREQQAADEITYERGNRRGATNRPEQANRQDMTNRPERTSSQNERSSERVEEVVTVQGTLQLQNGMVAVASGDTVYAVPRLTRYIGFINGLTEGTNVTVEGTRVRNRIQPAKVTIADRTYEFNTERPRQAAGNQNMSRRQDNERQRPQQNFSRDRRNSPSRSNCCCR